MIRLVMLSSYEYAYFYGERLTLKHMSYIKNSRELH